jgi:hypothetical protein
MDLKEKILQKFSDENNDCFHFENKLDLFDGQASTIFKAMDELSKIAAIAFADWLNSEGFRIHDKVFNTWENDSEIEVEFSSNELFHLFTQSKEYKELMDQK